MFSVHLMKLRESPKFGIIFWGSKGSGSMQENLEAQNIYGDCAMEREAIECREFSKSYMTCRLAFMILGSVN